MIISLSGAGGSGKSTVAEKLAAEFSWPRYYMGGLRRQKAAERGLTLAEYNALGEKDPQTDKEVDEYQAQLGKTGDNFIIEGRTSWYFIPHSLKIYLDVSLEEGAKRVFNHLQEQAGKDNRNEDKFLKSYEDVLNSLRKRAESDRARYAKYYNIDVNEKTHYDLFLDTSNLNPEQAYQAVLDFVLKYLDKGKKSL